MMTDTGIRVCILTYQTVHRKTVDTLCRLKMLGYTDVCVYACPLHYQKRFRPLVEHRPVVAADDPLYRAGYAALVRNLGYELREIEGYGQLDEPAGSLFLVCGAGIIPDETVKKYRLINAHPGYIPLARGLDALKWAIVEDLPIGVTTHFLGDAVDAGEVIERRLVPLYANDTFHAVAQRQYEMEVQMLVDAIPRADKIAFFTDGAGHTVHRRMPPETEKDLLAKFEQRIKGTNLYAIPRLEKTV